MSRYAIGHFYDRGYAPGKVHLVDTRDYAPVCNHKSDGDFQWIASGVQLQYITCEQCKLKAQKLVMVFAGLE